jgi:hypothetical protein
MRSLERCTVSSHVPTHSVDTGLAALVAAGALEVKV